MHLLLLQQLCAAHSEMSLLALRVSFCFRSPASALRVCFLIGVVLLSKQSFSACGSVLPTALQFLDRVSISYPS